MESSFRTSSAAQPLAVDCMTTSLRKLSLRSATRWEIFFSVAIYPPKSAMRPTQANAEEKKEEEQEAGETRTERRREGREQEDE
mmetsp:Transcript_6655/g.23473  ORF Transcript_6655/g.23473 Transcript_6655/m.23473 type:complete len:84 (-) Transcript_6655:181-432(-)